MEEEIEDFDGELISLSNVGFLELYIINLNVEV